MLEALRFSASAAKKGKYKLPSVYDGTVNETALYHAVRAFLAHQRQGTRSTKTRSEVSGGTQKPWRQKGTGRARQGTIRAAQWRGGGVVFGPKPRRFRVRLPRKVKHLARWSALNARASEGSLYVLEGFEFEQPRTKQMRDLLNKLKLGDKRVLVLTAEHRPEVYLSGRNLQRVHVMRYAEATAFEVLWADTLLVEEAALDNDAQGQGAASPTKAAAKRATKKKGAGDA